MYSHFFIFLFLSAYEVMKSCCLSVAARENITEIRQQLLSDIDQRSDNHKRPGHGYAEVRSLLHKFNSMVAAKDGIEMNDDSLASDALPAIDDGTELSVNRVIAADLFEGDIVLTLEQIQHMIDRIQQHGGHRSERKVKTNVENRWLNGIVPYLFAETDGYWQNIIRSAMSHWESETCVRFKESENDQDYVIFYKGVEGEKRELGCHSSIGRVGGQQGISIIHGCDVMGIVAHEIGHALGFYHEQSRPDRDNFINVRYQNIRDMPGNFYKRDESDVNDYGVAYDLGSVMHYGPKDFTIDQNLATIETKDVKYQDTIGQREHLSFVDIKQANKAYCADKCSRNLGCQNGGYEDPNDCDKCKCPDGLGGTLCDSLPQFSCGQELTANTEWQELSNSESGDCFWRITGAKGGKIQFGVKHVNYPCRRDEGKPCSSYVEIKHRANYDQTGFRVCCEAMDRESESEADNILVMSKGQGEFTLAYRSEGGVPEKERPVPTRTTTNPRLRSTWTTPLAATTPTEIITEPPIPQPNPMHTIEEPFTEWLRSVSGGGIVFTKGGGMIVNNGNGQRMQIGGPGGGIMMENGRERMFVGGHGAGGGFFDGDWD